MFYVCEFYGLKISRFIYHLFILSINLSRPQPERHTISLRKIKEIENLLRRLKRHSQVINISRPKNTLVRQQSMQMLRNAHFVPSSIDHLCANETLH